MYKNATNLKIIFDLSETLIFLFFQNVKDKHISFFEFKKKILNIFYFFINANKRYESFFLQANETFKFSSYLHFDGKKLKTIKKIKKSFLIIFDQLLFNIENQFKLNKNLFFFLNSLANDLNLLNTNKVISWILNFSKIIYFFKTKKCQKHIKKKLKKKYLIEKFLVNKNKRYNYTFKYIYIYSFKLKEKTFLERLMLSLKDLIFNYKNSKFYVLKEFAFKKIVLSILKN